jgi:membrane-associated phospholipid phosphatase
VWLQQHLYDASRIHWWDVIGSWVYFSHFVATFGVAIVLWLRARPRWAQFMRRWFALSVAGLITYFVYPAAPPWWAAQTGDIPQAVVRISTRGWHEFGMHGAGNLLKLGQAQANPIAAIPSLHTAFALFVVLFFLPMVGKRWWPLLLAYPLAMTFTLVYSGEHYFVDVLVGWAYVIVIFLVVGAAERWWWSRHPAAASGPQAAPADPAVVDEPQVAATATMPRGGRSDAVG